MFNKKLLIKIYKSNQKSKNYFDFTKLYLNEIKKKDKRRTRKVKRKGN